MAQAPREFALDFNRKKVYASHLHETPYTFSTFKNGDTERLVIYLVKANPAAGAGALSILSPQSLSLKVSLGKISTATSYTSVTLTALENTNYFTGDLPLTVAGVTALFSGQNADVSANVEFELNDGGYFQSFDVTATIRQEIITAALADPALPDVALSFGAAQGLYAPIIKPAGYREIWTNDDGNKVLVYFEGGVMRYDPIS